MKATTIKIEGELLQELEKDKPHSLSLSAYVRDVLRRDLMRRKLARAAASYQEFITAHPQEDAWLREWDQADLSSAPKQRRR
jgi:hypothetical protein